jgi:pectinesterase
VALSVVLASIGWATGAGAASAAAVRDFRDRPDEWFRTDEGRRVVDNIVTWQTPTGGWWKAYDPTTPGPAAPDGKGAAVDKNDSWHQVGTIDNDATYTEMRILGRAIRVTGNPAYKDSFQRGLAFLFKSQYANGGWPQRFPLQNNYGRHITYNDGAMTGVMNVLMDVAEGKPDFAFVSAEDRERARKAFDKGIECILGTQVKVDGKPTVWCQQHDEVTLAPAAARAYELPSLSGSESAEIVLVLMRVPKPDERVRQGVEGAVRWFDAAKITGKRVEIVHGAQYEKGKDTVVVDDPKAPPIWARFYDLETGKPFFCDRDGVKRNSMAEISHERRNGYRWYVNSGEKVAAAYGKWKERVASAG